MLRILTEQDIPQLGITGTVTRFGTTVYPDTEAPDWFYFPVLSKDNDSNACLIYRAKSDISQFVLAGKITGDRVFMPHVTRRYKDVLLNSDFDRRFFIDTKTGQHHEANDITVLRRIFGASYGAYCTEKGIPDTDESFAQLLATAFRPPQNPEARKSNNLYPKFRLYFLARHGNFVDLCNAQNLTLLSEGARSVLSLESGEERRYSTQVSSSAHFEIDEETDTIYLSNHNFVRNPEMAFFGPGSIDKFRYSNGRLLFEKQFKHPTAFRLTSHRVFSHAGTTYIATFGHPNRLFIIDADSMEPIHMEDIGRPIIPHADDLMRLLNERFPDTIKDTIVPIEAGNNGMLLFIGYEKVHFYDFANRRLVGEVPFLPSDNHVINSAHCQYV